MDFLNCRKCHVIGELYFAEGISHLSRGKLVSSYQDDDGQFI